MSVRIFFIIFLISFISVRAQYPMPTYFNTASNSTGTGTIPVNSNDLRWTVALTNSVTGPYVPAVSCGNQMPGTWYTSFTFLNANWISYPHTCSPNVADHSCIGNTDEFYRLIVNLPSSQCGMAITTPSAYCLCLDMYASNWISAVYVNGILTVNNPHVSPYTATGFMTGSHLNANLCSNWQAGTNTVIVHVKSGGGFPGYSGFLSQTDLNTNMTVGMPFSLATTQTNVACPGQNNGAASIYPMTLPTPTNYLWYPIGTNGNVVTGLSAGIYTVVATNGTCTMTHTVNIIEQTSFSLSASPANTICSGQSAVITASGGTTYSWSTGATTPTISVNTGGNYSVTMTSGFCTTTSVIPIMVEIPPLISVSGSVICSGQTATVAATGANTYTWSTGATSNTETISVTGNYTITGESAAGCINSYTFDVNAFATPTVSITPASTLVCDGQQVLLNAGGANTYTWNTGSVSSSITPVILSTTIFTLSGTDVNGCSNSASVTINMVSLPNVTLSGDPEICYGTSGMLNASGANSYLWNTGETTANISVSPTASLVYTITGTNTVTGCAKTETIAVQVSAYPQMTVTGTTFCEGKTGTISAQGANNYLWSNGSTQSSFPVTASVSTIYSVTGYATSTLCVATNTVLVEVVPTPTLSVNSPTFNLCRTGTVELSATGATTYSWNTGSTASTISVSPLSTSVFSVSTSSGTTGCVGSRTIQVNVIDLPPVSIFGDSMICDGQMISLTASGANNYLWNTGATTNEISVMMSPELTVFYVTGKNDKTGCSATDTIHIKESPACCELWVPNAFSPNGDNLNEEFAPKTLCEFKDYKMYVFNKWGEEIWSTSDVNEKWNGFSKGQPCKPDVYVYLIRATRLVPNLVSVERTGHIALIR